LDEAILSQSLPSKGGGGSGHASNSLHFVGDAVDINRFDGQAVTGRNAPAHVIAEVFIKSMPRGSGLGQVDCVDPKKYPGSAKLSTPAGISQFNDKSNHLHSAAARHELNFSAQRNHSSSKPCARRSPALFT
jgi:hypothetical protein